LYSCCPDDDERVSALQPSNLKNNTWSREEISELKKATKATSDITNKTERWKSVAASVGNGRSKRDCYEKYKELKDERKRSHSREEIRDAESMSKTSENGKSSALKPKRSRDSQSKKSGKEHNSTKAFAVHIEENIMSSSQVDKEAKLSKKNKIISAESKTEGKVKINEDWLSIKDTSGEINSLLSDAKSSDLASVNSSKNEDKRMYVEYNIFAIGN